MADLPEEVAGRPLEQRAVWSIALDKTDASVPYGKSRGASNEYSSCGLGEKVAPTILSAINGVMAGQLDLLVGTTLSAMVFLSNEVSAAEVVQFSYDVQDTRPLCCLTSSFRS